MMRRRAAILALTCLVAACNREPGTPVADCTQPSGPVEILRDAWGVPHVKVRTLPDAAFGQGYAQAADRLLQIDLLRRTARGMRAELLGADELEMDRLVRTLDLPGAARASLDALDPAAICLVDAFASGVNTYLERMAAGDPRAPRSRDLDVLDPAYLPPRWSRLDVVIVATAATFSLSSNLESDLVRTAAPMLLGEDLADALIRYAPLVPVYATHDPAEDPAIAAVTTPAGAPPLRSSPPAEATTAAPPIEATAIAAALRSFAGTWQRLKAALGPTASNNWAVAGRAAAGGGAMLASDPHGGIGIPSSFHEIHLMIAEPDLNVYGIAVAGGPMVHIGHNQHAAWAFTNYGADVGDLYRETRAPGRRDAVMRDGAPLLLETRREVIRVRPAGRAVAEAAEVTLDVKVVPGHGAILNDVLPQPLPLLFGDTPISYRWIGAGPTREAQALAGLATISDWQDFVANADDWEVGAQNTVFAGAGGDIGYLATGRFPQRPWASRDLDAIRPLPGDGSEVWQGDADFDDIRTLYDPPWGFVASANADPAGLSEDDDLWAPRYLGYNFDFGFRIARIRRVLAAAIDSGYADLATMQTLQTDVYVGFADMLAPLAAAVAARHPAAVSAAMLGPTLDTLANWDRQATGDAPGAAIFHLWVAHLVADYLATPVLEALRPLLLGDLQIALRALVRALSRGDARFFPDGVDTAVLAALAAARDDLVDWFDSADPADWPWGPLHVREFTHPLGGDLSRGPLPAPGGFAVVNRAEPRYLGESGALPLPWTIADGPDMRFVVEFGAAGPRARIMLPHGSSGDPDSPHYDDQIAPWIAGEYRDALFDPTAVEAAAVSRLRAW